MASHFRSTLAAAGAFAAAVGLSACNDGSSLASRSLAPIPSETLALMSEKGVEKDAPVLIRAFKKEAEFEVWKMRPDGKYVHLKTFPICRWSGQLGPKTREGDRQAPEGFYSIAPGQLNPNSSYYLSFNVGYPNAYDRAQGHTGGTIMVHGACSSAGCFSMSDRQIAEIYAIARTALNAGQPAIQMQSYPFHMTAENMARHRLDPNIGFWRQLKEGNDHFEVTKKEVAVGVCSRRYVFGAAGQHLEPEAPCPALQRDPQVAQLVAEKTAQDDAKVAELAQSGVKPIRLVYQDGGQHPDFAGRMAEVSRPELIAPPTEVVLNETPAKAAPAKSEAKARVASRKAPSETKVSAQTVDAKNAQWVTLHQGPEAAKPAKQGQAAKPLKDKGAALEQKPITVGDLSRVVK